MGGQRVAFWVARIGAGLTIYAAVETAVSIAVGGQLFPLSLAMAGLLFAVCLFGVVDRRDRTWQFTVASRMLRGVPLWASALWVVALVGVFAVMFAVAARNDGGSLYPFSLLGCYFAWSTTLLAWSRWRELSAAL